MSRELMQQQSNSGFVLRDEPQLFRLHPAGQNLISCLNEDKASC